MKHTSVGAIIKIEGQYLMLDRVFFPFGWACPAGHVKRNEEPEEAIKRVVLEETNLSVKQLKLLTHEFIDWNECRDGTKGHDWYLYEITELDGAFSCNFEAKDMGCFSQDKLMELELELVWNYWFSKLGIIN